MNRDYLKTCPDGRYYIEKYIDDALKELGVKHDDMSRYSYPHSVWIIVYLHDIDDSKDDIRICIYYNEWSITERHGMFVQRECTNPSMDIIIDWCSRYIQKIKL